MKKVALTQVTSVCAVLVAVVLCLLPFHALLTVWAGSSLGHYSAFRLWIEFALVPLAVWAAVAIGRDAGRRRPWLRDPLVLLGAAYIVWQLVMGVFARLAGWVNTSALLTGWAADLRFPAFLLVCWVAAMQRPWLARCWRQLLLVPAAIATGFGVLQAWVLPVDFLRHFGYGPQTIAPFSTVDQKTAYIRVQSTLRGPNPFGAYLVLPISALASTLVRGVKQRRAGALVFLALACAALGTTYSRSAYIGAVLSVAYLCWLAVPKGRARSWLLAGMAAAVLVFGAAFLAFRHNSQFQNTFFHTDSHSGSRTSSNAARSSALEQGVKDVLTQPLGHGPGSAGPASAHNNRPARIAENYYLQVGQEAGWIGLGLFLAINVLVAIKLWQRRGHQLAVVLLASFVGISFINMLSHAWADDTLGMLWWGFAGIACSLSAAQGDGAKNARIETPKKKAST
ncbi:MAG TPA: O-antigen ligase family protein [Candidatus Saccharimonadales bacterium]|nr:O-antigen ligase family protein [Candidatus Saccharimonadales bacterium]